MSAVIYMGGGVYRRLSLDSDPLAERDQNERDLDRLMREPPRPMGRGAVLTRNGNLVQPTTR